MYATAKMGESSDNYDTSILSTVMHNLTSEVKCGEKCILKLMKYSGIHKLQGLVEKGKL